MKLVRFIYCDKVADLCIRNNFYTRGDVVAYKHFIFELCCEKGSFSKKVSDSDIEEIARDIVSHSNRRAFEGIIENTAFVACVRTVVSMLANECCITEVVLDDKVDVKFQGLFMSLPFLRFTEILKLDVRYVGTDFDHSGYDIYEDSSTGCLYVTEIE